jgi:hypothetical protein
MKLTRCASFLSPYGLLTFLPVDSGFRVSWSSVANNHRPVLIGYGQFLPDGSGNRIAWIAKHGTTQHVFAKSSTIGPTKDTAQFFTRFAIALDRNLHPLSFARSKADPPPPIP